MRLPVGCAVAWYRLPVADAETITSAADRLRRVGLDRLIVTMAVVEITRTSTQVKKDFR